MAQVERTLWRRSDRCPRGTDPEPVVLGRISLTSCPNRAMCTSSSKHEEVANGHREQKSRTGNQADRQIQERGIRAEVIAGEEGKVKYRLADGREFKSLSSAGTAITGKACNGWKFWSIDPGDASAEGTS